MEDIEHHSTSERQEIDQEDWDEKNRKILLEWHAPASPLKNMEIIHPIWSETYRQADN